MYMRCITLMARLHITPCYPTISGRISCRPGFRVKGIARQLVKRIIPAYTLLRPTNALHIIKSLLELLLETGIHPCKTVSLHSATEGRRGDTKHENVEKSSGSGSIKHPPEHSFEFINI